MLAFRSSFVNSYEILRFISIVFAAWLFGTLPCFAASNENVAVRHIGHLNSTIVLKVLSQVHIVPFSFEHDSPILLQGKTMLRLHHKQKHELKATYRAGYSIVLLDATMQQITQQSVNKSTTIQLSATANGLNLHEARWTDIGSPDAGDDSADGD